MEKWKKKPSRIRRIWNSKSEGGDHGIIEEMKSEQKSEASEGFNNAEVRNKGAIRTDILRLTCLYSLNAKEADTVSEGETKTR